MPVVLLVRHGQASFGAEDYDELSEVGRQQSAVVGEELARRGLRRPLAVHGSLRRQRDTATLALQAAGVDAAATVDSRWDEYDHMGLLARYVQPGDSAPPTSSREVQGLLDDALHAWVRDTDGGWPAFAEGAAAALAELIESAPPGRDAVVFTSGGIVAAICAGLLGLGPDGVVALNRVTVNGAITTLLAGGSGTTLVTFNEHAHLTREQVTYR